ncbi:MAG: Na-translocating system protein MpsC family protein [Nostoc sp. DedVER02]|uniref:Na-translocating system protein MpsC family protein n=1 Tax=unclassified Nostoc TaxID=2593658 RepID=UPI002AD46394|nr:MULTISPECIES: Na-translocating system protein MpsC family protein [unclassified Nostoc]MDZ7988429.1 Na-translocating system protein MpsC family protein [Nostoc sp. DedVER02]MDZ8112167.1 Na-translocating system protein MpsC family protein [Nostoc sp. DedVER01b]
MFDKSCQIICHFFDIEIVISTENSVTQAEHTLMKGDCASLAEQVRLYLEKIIKPKLVILIEEIIGQPVLKLMINNNLATERTGIIVVFNQLPDIPHSESISKRNLKNLAD